MRRREISCLDDAVVIGFCVVLRGEEVFLTYLNGMIKFREEKRNKKDFPRVMMTLKGQIKWYMGENWHMLPLADTTGLGIEVRKWVGRYPDVLVE